MTNQPGTELDADRPKERSVTLFDYLASPKAEKEIKKALGTGADVKRYISGVVTTLAMQGRNSDLMQCSPVSIVNCILQAARLGLDIDSKGHAYMIPFKGAATIVPGYKGYIFKARQSPKVVSVWIEAVYKCDHFRVVMGTDPKIEHYPDVAHADYGNDAKITHFYACVKMRTGEIEFEIMTRAQVETIKTSTKVWGAYFGEMGKKTVFRRLQKKLQLPETAEIAAWEARVDSVYEDAEEPSTVPADDKEMRANVQKAMKALGWKAEGFKSYLAARGYGAWTTLSAAQKTSVVYDLEKQVEAQKAKKS